MCVRSDPGRWHTKYESVLRIDIINYGNSSDNNVVYSVYDAPLETQLDAVNFIGRI